jgi:hypothetical protein
MDKMVGFMFAMNEQALKHFQIQTPKGNTIIVRMPPPSPPEVRH